MVYSYFCKKGGVGKTTITGEHASYLASLGQKVLIISIDDQNSLFDMFGQTKLVFDRQDNYFEHLILGEAKPQDCLCELRPNVYAIKTLNTDLLSKKLTLERPFEKKFIDAIKKVAREFDVLFFDLPPSSNRTSEIVLDLTDCVILVTELSRLGVNGFYNTLQYFIDVGLENEKIQFVLPNGFAKNKSVPLIALDELNRMVDEYIPDAVVLPCLQDKSAIQALQLKGVTVFDKKAKSTTTYVRQQRKMIRQDMIEIFDLISPFAKELRLAQEAELEAQRLLEEAEEADDEEVIEETPVEEVPAEEPAPVEETPVEEAPAEEPAPIEEAPVEEAPAEEPAPVEEAPVEEAPAEEPAPIEEAPVEEAPAEEPAPVEEAPVEEAPAEEPAPVEETPVEEASATEE